MEVYVGMINKLKSYFSNIWFCVDLIWKADKRAFAVTLFFKAIEIVGTIVNMFVTRYLINQIIGNVNSSATIGSIVLLIVVYSFYNLLYQFMENYSGKISGIITTELITYLNISIMRKSVNLEYKYFDMPDKYNEFLRNQRSAAALRNVVDAVIRLIGSVVMFISMLACCLAFSVFWTLIAMAVLIPNYIFSVRFAKKGYALEKRLYTDSMKRDYIYSLFFSKNESQELRYGNAIRDIIRRYKMLSTEIIDANEKYSMARKVIGAFCAIPDILFIPALSVYIVTRIMSGILTLGDFTYTTGIFGNFTSSLNRMVNGIAAIYQYDEKIKDFQTYYGYIDKSVEESGRRIDAIDSVEFRNVWFRYPGREEYVLKDLSLKITVGEKIAVVGLNGSGKTTIFKLLCGFYPPESGQILLNGEDLNELNIKSVRRQMAVLFQDYTIYSLTIHDNVSISDLANTDKDDTNVREALDMAGFSNAVYDRERDIRLYIGKEFSDEGILPSGGQRQKLAIARALYRDASLIMLDEPSSALDPLSEYNMLENLEHAYEDRMLIMITHKLYNTKRMDKIFLIDEGTVVEEGTHDELMDRNEMYHEMFTIQNNKE